MPETPQDNLESTANGIVFQEEDTTSSHLWLKNPKRPLEEPRRKVHVFVILKWTAVSNDRTGEEIMEKKVSPERQAKRKVDNVVEAEISESNGVSRWRGRRSKKKVDDFGDEVSDAEIGDGEVVSRWRRIKKNVDDVLSEGEVSDRGGGGEWRRAREKVDVVDQVSNTEVSNNEGVNDDDISEQIAGLHLFVALELLNMLLCAQEGQRTDS
ncbi:hypothetical protein RJ641_012400 [Dillenia turbinata]|uniref:Uncharacterized protein n=1 Tax=Dillenia turbinata TaxID=194707 RepID=A0AAN8URM7_9MAGN